MWKLSIYDHKKDHDHNSNLRRVKKEQILFNIANSKVVVVVVPNGLNPNARRVRKACESKSTSTQQLTRKGSETLPT